jgi:predicted secreted protein
MSNAFIGLGTFLYFDNRERRKITAVTAADPGVVTVVGTNFTDGDIVLLHGFIGGMTQLNGQVAKVAGVAGQTFQLTDIDDNDIDTSGYDTYSKGGFVELLSEPSPVDWKALGEVSDVNPPSPTKETVDVTHMQSPDKYMEFISGLKDGGEASFTMNFTFDSYNDIKNNYELDDSPRKYKIVFPDSKTTPTIFEFYAIVTGVPVSAPTGDKVTSDVTLKVSGKTEMYQ